MYINRNIYYRRKYKEKRGEYFIFGFIVIFLSDLVLFIGFLAQIFNIANHGFDSFSDSFLQNVIIFVIIIFSFNCLGLIIILAGVFTDFYIVVDMGRKKYNASALFMLRTEDEKKYDWRVVYTLMFLLFIIALLFMGFSQINLNKDLAKEDTAYISEPRSNIFYHKVDCPDLSKEIRCYPIQALIQQGYLACPKCYNSE